MPKSYRIKTETNKDTNIRVNIEQDFDFLEILSLKLRQEDVYTRFCADYGVVVGRVVANGGFGIPNASVSIFVPLDEIDENNPIISELYPYKTPYNKNEDGYRYNLLPSNQEYGGHTPTGTFPSREDVLTRREILEVYEKYYKYTVRTNESGDFMIVGVPLGQQKVVLDLDLSNIGEFSLRPADFIRMGMATENEFDGTQFKSSENLDSLPQIIHDVVDVDVSSFWGQDDFCDIGITRVDFDLRDVGIEIQPTCVFMGSIFSSSDEDFIKANCKPKVNTGNLCDTVAGAGQILSIRQTIQTNSDGYPILEEYKLENDGKIIDENGVWLVDLPMNMEYLTTNEFGERVISNDPTIGIPTKSKYRFKIKWQNEGGLDSSILRANYLVPNIRETWDTDTEPQDNRNKSYSFSLDWNDYADISAAINCEDTFYQFNYNKVYTITSHIDRFKWGLNRARHVGIKEITDRACQTENNRFPVNDAQRNFDITSFLFDIFIRVVVRILIPLIPVVHVLALIYPIIRALINVILFIINTLVSGICLIVSLITPRITKEDCFVTAITPLANTNPFKQISLPMITYPDCQACSCEDTSVDNPDNQTLQDLQIIGDLTNKSKLANFVNRAYYDTVDSCDVESYLSDYLRYSFSGWDGSDPSNDGFNNNPNDTPHTRWLRSPTYITTQGTDRWRATDKVTLAQSINLMNARSRYFLGKNIIKTTIENKQFGTSSGEFTDLPMMLILDETANVNTGDILTFNNPDIVSTDINTSGLTSLNQFNNNAITGTVTNNQSGYIQKTISYIDEFKIPKTATLDIYSTDISGEYRFKMGVEYYQVISATTVGVVEDLLNSLPTATKENSILYDYIFNKKSAYKCNGGNKVEPVTIEQFDDYRDLTFIFLVKGVDPNMQKQTLSYDMSRIFGKSTFDSSIVINGDYYLNVPIQRNYGNLSDPWYYNIATPEPHHIFNGSSFNDRPNNNNNSLFHSSFVFTPDSNLFSSFTTTATAMYSAIDKHVSAIMFGSNGILVDNNYLQVTNGVNQGIIEGATYQYTTKLFDIPIKDAGDLMTISPSYTLNTTNIPKTTFNNSDKLLMRTDRLPMSDDTDEGSLGVQSFALMLNNNFTLYKINSTGDVIQKTGGFNQAASDDTGNASDFGDDANNKLTPILDTFTCTDMVPLGCYEGYGENFGVEDPCDTDIILDYVPANKRVKGGCYYFVNNPLIVSIPSDIQFLFEWMARIRVMFAACRGVIGESFNNNWVNGTLYMPAFQKKTFFNSDNEVSRYKYCGDYEQNVNIVKQGPIYYNTDSNSFYYRSTPYYNGEFIGQEPTRNFANTVNEKNIWYPTTIMDMGSREEFLKEIMLTPEFENYVMDTISSTSYKDTSDVINLFITSRLINANILEKILGIGDASVSQFFSREGGVLNNYFDARVDGDFAQMAAINSEYGVLPYIDGNYDDSIFVGNEDNEIFGIWYSSNTKNRRILGAGITTFGNNLNGTNINNFGYKNSQEVPYYKWKMNYAPDIVLFGTQNNTWDTSQIFSSKYQGESLDIQLYPKPDNGYGLGYIYNKDADGNESDDQLKAGPQYRVGNPFYFYFGLKRGKSAINKFINKYITIID